MPVLFGEKIRAPAALLVLLPFFLCFLLLKPQLEGKAWLGPFTTGSSSTCGSPLEQQQQPFLARPWEGKVMPDSALARGMTYQGSGEALTRLGRRLIDGVSSNLVWIGGSVTFGRGASTFDLSYASLVKKWVQTSFPGNHTYTNNAMSGTTSGLAASCTHHLVPENASLVIIEFSANDIRDLGLHDPQRGAFETLLRRLLSRPVPPAILLLHHWCWWVANKERVDANIRGLYDEPDTEFDLTLIGQYYNVPSVSVRAGIWPLMKQGVPRFETDGFGPHKFFVDPCHPSDHGHQALADIVIHALQSAAGQALQQRQAESAAAAAAAVLVQQRSGGPGQARPQRQQLQQPGAVQETAEQQRHEQEKAQEKALAEWVPPPLQTGVTDDAAPALCMLQDDFERVVVNASGFRWAPDFPEAATRAEQKWSWSASQIGDWAELSFDTRDPRIADSSTSGDSAEAASSKTTTVYLGYLRSYKGMGLAELQCMEGCTCKLALLDGHWDIQVSLVQAHHFKVGRHKECRVRVTVVGRPQQSMEQTGEGVTGRVVLRSLVVATAPVHLGGERKR